VYKSKLRIPGKCLLAGVFHCCISANFKIWWP